jgi:restriction system protein
MAFPKRAELETAILEEVARGGGRVRPATIYDKVGARFSLTDEEKAVFYPGDPHTPKWVKDQQWTRQALVRKGDLDSRVKGEWVITRKGLSRIGKTVSGGPQPGGDQTPSLEPQEQAATTALTIARLAQDQEAAVKVGLMAKLKQLSPQEFERLVGRVLEALGFPVVTVTGRTGDEGVDGECAMALLDLKVAFQAKRYTSNSVGGPLMAEFRGRITGRYERGVYITTSTFTQGAREMAEHPGGPKILLIDGDGLVEQMLAQGLGVKAEPLVLKQIDDDFFTALAQ